MSFRKNCVARKTVTAGHQQQMGLLLTCCTKQKPTIEEQYQSLVVTKPLPISLEKVDLDSSDSVPLFESAGSNGERLSDEEQDSRDSPDVNLYAGNA